MRLLALEDSIPRVDPSNRCCRSQEDPLGLEAPSAGVEHDARKTFHQSIIISKTSNGLPLQLKSLAIAVVRWHLQKTAVVVRCEHSLSVSRALAEDGVALFVVLFRRRIGLDLSDIMLKITEVVHYLGDPHRTCLVYCGDDQQGRPKGLFGKGGEEETHNRQPLDLLRK